MRKLFVLIILISLRSYSQNLVPNPSFEEYNLYGSGSAPSYYSNVTNTPCSTSCCWSSLPEFPNKLNGATYNWWTVNRGVIVDIPDNYYFNKCTITLFEGIQQEQGLPLNHYWYKPRTGEAFIMIYIYGDRYYINDPNELRSYIQVKLKEPLKAGYIYEASCFALLTTNIDYLLEGSFSVESQAADGFGMYFSKDSVYGTDPANAYNAMTNFSPQVSNPSGHLLSDSVNYQKVSGIFTAVGGEEWLIIGNFKDNVHTITANKVNIRAGNRQLNSIYSIDDISVIERGSAIINIPNLITVNGDGKNDYFVIKTEGNRTFELSIYNSLGSQIYRTTSYQNDWNANGLDSGIYFYYLNDPLMNKNYKGWLQVIK